MNHLYGTINMLSMCQAALALVPRVAPGEAGACRDPATVARLWAAHSAAWLSLKDCPRSRKKAVGMGCDPACGS